MAGVQPTKFINYISEFKKLLVTRANGIIQQKFKIDSATDDNYYFSIVNSNNRLISLTGRAFKIYGSIFDSKDQMHILFYSDKCTIEQNGQQMHFKIDTYTSQYMNIVKTNKIIDLTIVEVVNPDDNIPDEEQITQVILRDTAIAYKRPYIENQTPAEILQKVILTTNVPLTGVFGSGQDINLTIGSNGAAFGTGLTQTGDNQLVIGQYNEADATKAFIIGNGENDTVRSNLFTIDYEGNIQTPGAISANTIVVDGQDVGDKVNQLENDIEAVSAAIPSVEGFATEQWVQEQGYLTAHQDLTAYATKDWVEGKGYITGVNLDPYATKDQLTAYATKSDLTVSASVLSNQISQLALNIPTKVSDLTNDAGYLTAVPTSYALKTDIPTGNAQLQNTAGYITGYNAGTGISISNGTISLTGEVGKTYYADNNTLQLNNTTNTFSIKSLSSKLNQGQNILLTPQSDGSVTINAIGGGGGGTGGATYLAGLGLGLSTVSAEDAIYKFYVNEPWLDNKINTATSGIQNLSAGTGLEIEDNVISLTAEIPSIDGLASEQWVETNFLSAIPSNYATKDYVDSSVSGKADLSSVYTKEEVYTYIETDAKINQATSGKADKSEVQAVDDKFDNYYTSAQVDQAIASAVEDIPSTVYTGVDGISVEDGVISLTATLSSITNDAGFITSAEIPTSYVQQSELETVSGQLTNAIGAKANTTQVEAEFTATSAWANETFLTEHQSLDNYYNKTEVDTALALKADSADVYTKTEVNNISTNIVSQIPTDVATSAYVQAASGNAVSVATGWVEDKNYLSSINVIQQDTSFDENTSKLFFNTGFSLAQTEDMVRVDIDTNSIATQEYVNGQVSGKADQSTVEGLSTQLSTAIDTKANSADVYTKTEVYTKGETDTAINTATSGKVNKTDFDTVTGALSSAIDTKTTSGEVKTQIEAYGYQNATDVANAISGKADKSELQSVSGTLNTAIGGVSDRVGAIEADYTTSAQVSNIVTGYDYISAITVINEYQQFEENTKKLTFDTGFGLTQTEDTVRIELDVNYVATVDALSSVSGTLTGQISAVDTKATNNTNSINALTGRVKAIEDDYTTSAYVTGQVNNLATGAVATNTTNIGQLSTNVNTISTTYATTNYVNTVSSTLSTELTGWVVENTLTGYTAGSGLEITEDNVIQLTVNTIPSAVSQLVNDSNFITYADIIDGVEYHAGEGLSLINNTFALTGTVLSGDGTTIQIVDNVISAIGGAGTTYTAGTGIAISNENVISLTAQIPTTVAELEDAANYALTSTLSSVSGTLSTAIDNSITTSSGAAVDVATGWVQEQDYAKYDDIGSVVQGYGYQTAADVQNAIGSSSGAIVQAATGAITVPTKISDLTNDSQFATSAQVSAIVTGFNYLTGITIEDAYDQTSHVSSLVLTDDFSYYNELYWNGLFVDNQAGQGNGDYRAKKLVFSNDFSVNFGDEVSEISINSDILSGYATKTELQTTSASIVALIPAVPSTVYDKLSAGSNITLTKNEQTGVTTIASTGGGGGTTYTAGDGIDITNDEISVKLSGGNNVTLSTDATGLVTINATGGGGSTNLIAGNRIRLTETAQGTRIDVLDYRLSSTNQTYNWDMRNANQSGQLEYGYVGETGISPVYVNFSPALPTGIDFNQTTHIFSGVNGIANGNTTVSTTILAADSVEAVVSTTFNVIGVVTAEFSGSTQNMDLDFSQASSYISSFTYNYVDGTAPESIQAILSNVPEGVTITSAYANGVVTITLSGSTETIGGNTQANIGLKLIANDTIETSFTILITVTGIVVRTPLTFTAIQANSAVKLVKSGSPSDISLQYKKNNGDWTAYTIGTQITLENVDDFVMFSGANSSFSTDYNAIYQFQMSGRILGSGSIQSLLNFSDTAPDYCFYNLFKSCSVLVTSPDFPATTLGSQSYSGTFSFCSLLTGAPALPATTLTDYCYYGMFTNCSALSTAPFLPATTLVGGAYGEMFINCSNLNYVSVNLSAWNGSATRNWLSNVAANGTFVCPTSLGTNSSIERSADRCPSNWTVENT